MLVVSLFMSLIDVSIVNVALPSIQTGLHASDAELQWVLLGYALTFGVGLVAAGRAGDIFGRGPLFILGVALFTAASVASGLAPTALVLNVSRAVQGIDAGIFNRQGIGMIQQYFRGAERARAFGIFGGAVGVSVAVGPLLGGLLIHAGGVEEGWRWVFYVNLPVGILAIVLAAIWIPKPLLNRNRAEAAPPGPPGVRSERQGRHRDLDVTGAVILGLAVVAVLFPFLQSRESGAVWLALPVGLVLVAVWLWWERRYKGLGREPMVDLEIFRTTSFANGTLLVSLYFLGMTSVWVLVALALSILVVWLHAEGRASEWWLLGTLSFIGVAQGSVISPNQALTLAEVPLKYAGSSGGIMQTGQRIGTSVGIAIITAIAFTVLGRGDWALAFNVGFAAIFVVVVLALVVGYVDLRGRHGGDWLQAAR